MTSVELSECQSGLCSLSNSSTCCCRCSHCLPINRQKSEKASLCTQTTDAWQLHLKFSTARLHIPNPNRKSCKMYENLSFLQKKMAITDSTTQNTSWLIQPICLIGQNIWDIWKKKLSLGVRSPWLCIKQ